MISNVHVCGVQFPIWKAIVPMYVLTEGSFPFTACIEVKSLRNKSIMFKCLMKFHVDSVDSLARGEGEGEGKGGKVWRQIVQYRR